MDHTEDFLDMAREREREAKYTMLLTVTVSFPWILKRKGFLYLLIHSAYFISKAKTVASIISHSDSETSVIVLIE